VIETGKTPAEDMLEQFHGSWHGSVEPAYDLYAF
jgi:glutamate--cysteine ligase